MMGESPDLIKEFEEAETTAPSIVFIDAINTIPPKRERINAEFRR